MLKKFVKKFFYTKILKNFVDKFILVKATFDNFSKEIYAVHKISKCFGQNLGSGTQNCVAE